MSESIISDNWALQDTSKLLVYGLDESSSHSIKIDTKEDSHQYIDTPQAVIQTQALFDLITDLILRNQIIVDEEFVTAWNQLPSALDKAVEAGVIRTFPFLKENTKLEEPRNEFIDRLCVTSSLKKGHKENVDGWEENQYTPHGYLSQTLWGGAGMMARGFVYEKGYTPHPSRTRLFIEAGIAMEAGDATIQLNSLISEKRAQVISKVLKSDELHALNINMPPLPAMVIRESNSVDDLIGIALELRQDYQELRNWLCCYQQALSDGTYRDIDKFRKILHSISLYVDSKMGETDPNSPTFSAGLGVLKISFKARPLNDLQNQFGVRSMINRLIFSKSGNSDLKKYLSLFDHQGSPTGLKILESFSQTIT